MRNSVIAAVCVAVLSACGSRKPFEWKSVTPAHEQEYNKYMAPGTATLQGQAFLQQRNGQTVKAAGRLVTLDPATSLGAEWWEQYGQYYMRPLRDTDYAPSSEGFTKTRRETTADSEGRFKFTNLPAGKYYLRTTVTWEIVTVGILGPGTSQQGGMVVREIEIKDGEQKEMILSSQQ